MNKMNYAIHLLAAVILMSFIGCTDEVAMNHNGNLQVSAGFAQSRTTYVNDNGTTRVNWEVGDEIGLIQEVERFEVDGISYPKCRDFKYAAQNAGSTTTFAPTNDKIPITQEGEKIYACSPYTGFMTNAGKIIAQLPDMYIQRYKPNASMYDFIYTSGTVTNNKLHLQFKHAFAFLKFTISKKLLDEMGENNALFIKSTERLAYSGDFYIETGTISPNYGSTSIDYILPTEEEMTGKDEVDCYIAILPQPETAEINIYENKEDGGSGRLLATRKVPAGGFKAGNVYTLYLENEVEKSQRDALVALYNAAGGKDWERQRNWCSEKPISEWEGVKLNSLGYVWQLSTKQNVLNGCIPPEMSQLTELTDLFMSGNRETYGTLDVEESFKNLAKIPKLGSLYMSFNNLSYDISKIDFSKFSNLSSLELDECFLYGKLPESMKQMTRLKSLTISRNRWTTADESKTYGIEGEIASLFPYWSNLERFVARDCLLSGSLPELTEEQQQKMVRFEVQGNAFTGNIPESHTSIFNNLEAIQNDPNSEWNYYGYNIRNNALSGKIPEVMVNHPLFPLIMQDVMLQGFEPYVFDKIDIPWWSFTTTCEDGEVINFKELFQKNKYTIIWHLAECNNAFDLDNMAMPKKYAKLKELYGTQGLEVIFSKDLLWHTEDESFDESIRWEEITSYMPSIREIKMDGEEVNPYNKVTPAKDCIWRGNTFGACSDGSAFGDFYIIDSKGHLIYYGYGGGKGMKLSHGYPENSEDVFKFVANLFGDKEFPM